MRKQLILALALVMVAAFAVGAYAEVQNVKISGDINVNGVVRNNMGLQNDDTLLTKERHQNNFFMTQVRLRLDADLTDNVSAVVRLINEREWGNAETTTNTDIDLDLAYVTLKEFLYSPLTLTVGRQELKLGNQLIVGNARSYTRASIIADTGIPQDLTERGHAFDAIRATLNYDPLVVDIWMAKVRETTFTETAGTTVSRNGDYDVYGINGRYEVSKKVAAEGYFLQARNRHGESTAAVQVQDKQDITNVIGGILTVKPVENMKASLEAAYQYGNMREDTNTTGTRSAFAIQGLLDYTFAKIKYTPNLGGSYTYLSGGKDNNAANSWNPLFYNQRLNDIAYALFPFTNMQVFNLRAGMKPAEDIKLTANYGYYLLVEKGQTLANLYTGGAFNTTDKKDLGQELDLTATYDYTEDVQFGLTGGMFFSGAAIKDQGGDRAASQVIGSMKVTF